MIEVIFSAVIAYIGTNIDDLFIGMVLYLDAGSIKSRFAVSTGKFLGIGLLVLISLAGAYGLGLIFNNYLWLLGLIPIFLGIREAIKRDKYETENHTNISILNTAAITVANGADNIGVYIPLFTGCILPRLLIILLCFVLMTGLWCILSARLAALPGLRAFLTKYRKPIVPAVLISLGIYIILKGIL